MLSSYDSLKLENMHLQIAMTVVMFALFGPVILSAYKTSKIIGWQVYKKIGSSIELQNMYNIVQWFALLLKIDIFFEVFIMICTAIVTSAFNYRILCCIMVPVLIVSLILARIAITKENHGMMFIFLFSQVILFAMNIYSSIELLRYSPENQWFAGISYVFASMICICISIYLAIRCLLNFGKGLKPFVNWMPFQGTKKHMEEPPHYSVESGLLGTTKNEDRQPIDDDDDDFKSMNEKNDHTPFQSPPLQASAPPNYSAISRTSLERVESKPPNIYKLDSIKIISSSMSDKPPRLTLKPVQKDTLVLSPISTSPAVLRAVNRDDSYDDIPLSSATISGLNDFAIAKNSIEIMQNK
ncbi:uncharacterized protein B0P05DRAFT_135377 [Gilbertella persicaria]|uniref:uncharacterized protein n=1 Tax=Gilbertella persicaria TaxID=101096 RepID=UPI00221F1CEB|nr:uncharacterized protein B0P05DRAFT_135377 [Gilbertella persicaria]KAI8076680.1 hypothetical protein B0P05DRAFT_135377 [Gilbertella persicaria]